ncbi:galactose oxidase [Rhizophagus irregularis]|uniref:Galactose oxidase n=1 Tax=Rhizophagus irregularis TaxID=588596 RepID=A0A2N0RWE2_9GLOM|nr:galactose oxidase [Rhizophagus irregularis]PKC67633.1 galactose oxidase [Rhizophagus irregularis]CAB4495226.1 unnamed protein product [Rhizophagus irregularis]CAB5093756.1 unnamed protein product [Rhizophagus irregularis]CAB5382101.1 unnamed protein product [Rhizophagus irregularis]
MSLNHYLIFIITLCILNVYGQFVPDTRTGHSAVFSESEKKVYYIGGYNSNKSEPTEPNPISDFFYLSIGNDDFFEFTDLTSQAKLPLTVFHVSELGGANQDSIFILEGAHWNAEETNYVYRFDTKINQLSIPVVKGKAPSMRKGISSVSSEGKIYLFGGQIGSGNDVTFFNNFDIFDTINLNWQVGSLVNSPVGRSFYTATLVNGVIYYIGGRTQVNVYSPLTEIYQYDIVANTWSLKKATAVDADSMPGSRTAHSAVLINGKIVIYGGFFSSADTPYNIPAKKTIAMLDVNTLVWSIPNFDIRKENLIPNLAFHSGTAVGTVMLIAFGNFTDIPNNIDQTNKVIYSFLFGNPSQITSNVISSFIKVNSSNNPKPQLPTSTSNKINPQQPSSLSKVVIVGVSIVSVSVALAIFAAISVAYKRKKKNQVQSGDVLDNLNNEKNHYEYQQQYTSQFASQQSQQHYTRDPPTIESP